MISIATTTHDHPQYSHCHENLKSYISKVSLQELCMLLIQYITTIICLKWQCHSSEFSTYSVCPLKFQHYSYKYMHYTSPYSINSTT
jgi:hypothetical protein